VPDIPSITTTGQALLETEAYNGTLFGYVGLIAGLAIAMLVGLCCFFWIIRKINASQQAIGEMVANLKSDIANLIAIADDINEYAKRQGSKADRHDEALHKFNVSVSEQFSKLSSEVNQPSVVLEAVQSLEDNLKAENERMYDKLCRRIADIAKAQALPSTPPPIMSGDSTQNTNSTTVYDEDKIIHKFMTKYTIAESDPSKRTKFIREVSALSFTLDNRADSDTRGEYALSEYSIDSGAEPTNMMLIHTSEGNAIILPCFNRAVKSQQGRFSSDGLHRFFKENWNEEYPKLSKPAKVKTRGNKVIELIEMGEY